MEQTIPGMRTGRIYYAYYLTAFQEGRIGQCIACSTSPDLYHWEYQGIIMEADPDGWDNAGLATGSVTEYNGRWYMLYTGVGATEDAPGGMGLAVSDDLIHWERVGDGPVLPRRDPYTIPCETGEVSCRLIANTPDGAIGPYELTCSETEIVIGKRLEK